MYKVKTYTKERKIYVVKYKGVLMAGKILSNSNKEHHSIKGPIRPILWNSDIHWYVDMIATKRIEIE